MIMHKLQKIVAGSGQDILDPGVSHGTVDASGNVNSLTMAPCGTWGGSQIKATSSRVPIGGGRDKSVAAEPTNANIEQRGYGCNICSYMSSTKAGLGQHCRWKHPTEWNNTKCERILKRTKNRWDNEDDVRLRELADSVWDAGHSLAKDVFYNRVHEAFGGRTREAIKRRLLGLKWTPKERTSQPPRGGSDNSGEGAARNPRMSGAVTTDIDTLGTGAINENHQVTSNGGIYECWRVELLQSILNTCPKNHALFKLARALLNKKVNVNQGRDRLNVYVSKSYPHKRKRVSGDPGNTTGVWKSLQKSLKRNFSRGAGVVLSGRWRAGFRGAGKLPERFEEYWSEIFGKESTLDERPIKHTENNWDLVKPITVIEVQTAIKKMGNTAPGLDGVTPRMLYIRRHATITALLNLMLVMGIVPDHFNLARVVFLPKVEEPKVPSDFRPIAITSVVLRCLHSIIVKRWSMTRPHFHAQVAFQKRDGCFEATLSLHAVLREAHVGLHHLALCAIDVSKAFDSVSHDTIVRVAAKFGAPPPLTDYIRETYKGAAAEVLSKKVNVRSGVRQGDPLSPLLFIMCMDEVIRHTNLEIGAKIGEGKVDSLMYADDVILFARTKRGLQCKIEQFSVALGKAGLFINSNKSFALTLVPNGKEKTMAVMPYSYTARENTISPLTVNDCFDFLGIRFSAKGLATQPVSNLTRSLLKEVNEAPLTPDQRVNITKGFVIPRLHYPTQLGLTKESVLREVDVLIRRSIKSWLRLPHDTVQSFLHASVKDGGLGVESLGASIPLRRRLRFRAMYQSDCPLIQT
ncbi:hypothetical protein MN116_000333, partial [Schistosoma mekongi]